MGRAFIVRSGITNMLQLATPYANDDDTEGSLDTWVRRIKTRHPVPNVTWLRQPGRRRRQRQDAPCKMGTAVIKQSKRQAPISPNMIFPISKRSWSSLGFPKI
jgi:hypothetical protein